MNDLKVWLKNDVIEVEVLPAKKKGILRKYVEFTISSARYRSQVSRRYNDFVALHEQLLQRFPYRLIPKLPPAAITAIFSTADSEFMEVRRRALKRWLILISSHTVLNEDPAFKFFLTHMNAVEHAAKIKEDYENHPIEYVSNPRSGEFQITSEMKAGVNSAKLQIEIVSICVDELCNFIEKSLNRKKENAYDMQRISNDLKPLTNESYFTNKQNSEDFNSLREVIPAVCQIMTEISDKKKKHIKETEIRTLEIIRLLQDMMSSHKDLLFRKERDILNHQITAIRKKGPTERETEELRRQDRLFNDVEQTNAFSLNCIAEEKERIFSFIGLLGNTLAELSRLESTEIGDERKEWIKIKEVTMPFSSMMM